MLFRSWSQLPSYMRKAEVKEYYLALRKKQNSLKVKRVCDIVLAVLESTVFDRFPW